MDKSLVVAGYFMDHSVYKVGRCSFAGGSKLGVWELSQLGLVCVASAENEFGAF